MSAIKGLLLGTAAGLVAVAGAQAADMPVKAKPVQFVKICTLYGDGFYYIPGTDTCLKLGGYVRVQTETHAGGGVNDGTLSQITQARYNRVDTNDVDYRIRAALSLDVRDQTQYGTLRSYFRIGVQQTTPADPIGGAVFWDRAFIQWAGFTVGKAQSFFDTGSYEHFFSYQNVRTGSNTIDTGWNVWAYTAELGNGWSATLSLEDPNTNKRAVCESTVAGPAGSASANCFNYGSITADNAFGLQTTSNNGMRMPDVIANVRLEQAWGYWSLSGALHDVAGAYYGTPNNVNNGHPTDRKGWAVGTGVQFNLPGGDVLGINGQYSEGAAGYGSAGGQWAILNPGTSAGVGWQVDGVFTNGGEIELTKVWNVIAWYQHIWNPKWRTSIYGGYVSTEYNDAAKLVLNPVAVCGGTGPGVVGITLQPGNSCSPDFSYWQAGTRTQWNPHPLLDIGLEVYYTRLNTAYKGPATVSPGGPQQPVGLLDDQDVWSAIVRWQRNFYP